jgi:hypothetical protein
MEPGQKGNGQPMLEQFFHQRIGMAEQQMGLIGQGTALDVGGQEGEDNIRHKCPIPAERNQQQGGQRGTLGDAKNLIH